MATDESGLIVSDFEDPPLSWQHLLEVLPDGVAYVDEHGVICQANERLEAMSGYAREELVAELGSAFLCADLGITPEVREDHAAYIGSWIKVLKDDKRAIFSAASHAQRAADYLHGLQKSASPEPGAVQADAA